MTNAVTPPTRKVGGIQQIVARRGCSLHESSITLTHSLRHCCTLGQVPASLNNGFRLVLELLFKVAINAASCCPSSVYNNPDNEGSIPLNRRAICHASKEEKLQSDCDEVQTEYGTSEQEREED